MYKYVVQEIGAIQLKCSFEYSIQRSFAVGYLGGSWLFCTGTSPNWGTHAQLGFAFASDAVYSAAQVKIGDFMTVRMLDIPCQACPRRVYSETVP